MIASFFLHIIFLDNSLRLLLYRRTANSKNYVCLDFAANLWHTFRMIEQLDVPKKTCLFVFGVLQWCKDNALIAMEGGMRLTPGGVAAFDQLEASGFRPEERDVAVAIDQICLNADDDFKAGALVLVMRFDEIREMVEAELGK